MTGRLLALPFLAVWLLAGVVAVVVLCLVVHVRRQREAHLPYRTPSRAVVGMRAHTEALRRLQEDARQRAQRKEIEIR